MKVFAYLLYNFVFFFKMNLIKFAKAVSWYLSDFVKFHNQENNINATANLANLTPYLADRTIKTEIEPIYFLQDIWLAENVFKSMPKKHVDIGSNSKTVAIISRVVPTVFVDIRPPDIPVDGLNFVTGSVLKLPFKSKSLSSVSSICVLEHIGLGRYGDKIDSWGSEKAITELSRVIRSEGDLYISVPVDATSKVFFNAHRTFTRNYLLSLFELEFELKEEKYIYGKKIYSKYDERRGFGTGLYNFIKR